MISLFGFEAEATGRDLGAPLSLAGLTGVAKGVVTASLTISGGQPLMVVTDKAATAEEMYASLRFFLPDEAKGAPPVLFFPPWEILPCEELSPHPEVAGQRLSTLARLVGGIEGPFVLVTSVEALCRKVAPPDVVKRGGLTIETGDRADLELLVDHLAVFGYQRVDMVEERGEFSVRGGIVDLFEGEGEHPVRIEFFGDEVESIRRYNPDTQRSLANVESVDIFPFREVFYEGVDRADLARRYAGLARSLDLEEEGWMEKREALADGRFFPGVERLLPLFFPGCGSLFSYLPNSLKVVIDEPENCDERRDSFYRLIESGMEEALKRGEPLPGDTFVEEEELQEELVARSQVMMRELGVTDEEQAPLVLATRSQERYRGDTKRFVDDLHKYKEQGYSVILTASSKGRAERLERFLAEREIGVARLDTGDFFRLMEKLSLSQPGLFDGPILGLVTADLRSGLTLPADKWAIITDDDIFGALPKKPHRRRKAAQAFGVGLGDLKTGDLVTHETHGVGRYVGYKEMVIGEDKGEYLELEYADRQRLFLPIGSVNLIRKFIGAGGAPPALDKMGGSTWKKTKTKVKKAIMEMAGKLIALSASRELSKGVAYTGDGNFHQEFADAFEFEETEDQAAAISDVTADMERERPMDRLVCGDVGYGKTEVAMRAAFKAVFDGKQVALLAPTTILAQQHYYTFSERFRAFPVSVEVISRFKSAKETKEIVARAAAGEVDVLIGTHRLLQKDVSFRELGLVIVDEEQRFGVRHKEKLKSFAVNVDILTLTATPIPRTLHTAMVGIRDLSVIETPPIDRQAVQNVIAPFSEKVITDAITRELDRGGQVFFVHNKVHNIESVRRFLEKVTPEAKVAVAHGQTPERELQQVMLDFVDKKFDLLLSTTIIESGLDIPAANTMIINRADHFGLAQLYQLRGRVGRDRRRAYCYFLIPGIDAITEVAKERLKAIEELSELGSGFRLAARDMEIRGAGNLLGPEQSGNIDSVGFDTYTEMLEEAVMELRGEEVEGKFEVTLNLVVNGRLSPDYVPGVTHRMELYNRLNQVAALDELNDLEKEMRDRFGPPPEETEKLLSHSRIRLLCRKLKIEKVDIIRDRLSLRFSPSTPIDPAGMVTKAYEKGISFRFAGENVAEVLVPGSDWRQRFGAILDFLDLIAHAKEPPRGSDSPKGA